VHLGGFTLRDIRDKALPMTQVLDMPLPDSRASEQKLVLGVCFAHFVSHYYITLLAPLFVFIKEDYAVSYTDLGLALTAFNVASTVLQTPTGFLVDRVNARLVIIAGLLLGAAAIAIAGLINSYWVFVAMFAVAGIGNTVYHRPTIRCSHATCRRNAPAASSRTTPFRDDRQRRCARDTRVDVRPCGLARRVPRRRRAWRRRSLCAFVRA